MTRHLAIKISRFCVLKLRNSLAITRVSRLEAEYFNLQSVRPRLDQRFLKKIDKIHFIEKLIGFGIRT